MHKNFQDVSWERDGNWDGPKAITIRGVGKVSWQEDKGEKAEIGEQQIMDGQECKQEG